MENDTVNIRYRSVLFVYQNDAPPFAEPFCTEYHIASLHKIQFAFVAEIATVPVVWTASGEE